jgi:hypothetical protein
MVFRKKNSLKSSKEKTSSILRDESTNKILKFLFRTSKNLNKCNYKVLRFRKLFVNDKNSGKFQVFSQEKYPLLVRNVSTR